MSFSSTPTTATPDAFMTTLGHLKVSVEQEGVRLYHEAAGWLDHLSWQQVEHLLIPAIRQVAPGILPAVAHAAQAVADTADAPLRTTTDSDGEEGFQQWATRQIDKLTEGLADLRALMQPAADPAVPVGEAVPESSAAAPE